MSSEIVQEEMDGKRVDRVSLGGVDSNKTTKISGPKLRKARGDAYMSQQQLANLLGVSEGRVRQIERAPVAGIYTNRVPKLASALKMPADEVVKLLAPDEKAGPDLVVTVTDQRGRTTTLDDALSARLAEMARGKGVDPIDFVLGLIQRSAKGKHGVLTRARPSAGAGADRDAEGRPSGR
jgi:transcriptional regulator with XRE-family HTH domain